MWLSGGSYINLHSCSREGEKKKKKVLSLSVRMSRRSQYNIIHCKLGLSI
jgi:hypothetical protein